MPLEKALDLARQAKLDLVEISPTANPPVTQIIDFDKFRYQQRKKLKKQQQAQKKAELKHIKVSARTALNDLKTKAELAKKFLAKNHKVEISVYLKGREQKYQQLAKEKLEQFLELIDMPYKTIMPSKKVGKGYRVEYRTQIAKE